MDLEAAALLLGYTWPGNVRELRHVIARAVALSDGPILQESLLPPEIRRESDRALGDALLSLREDYRTASEAYARLYFTHLLARHGGNLSEAARKAGIGRTTLYTRLQELGLRPPKGEEQEEDGGGSAS
jgi:DNA-binding NtrC family response regulator